jgi:hypothetical protein
VLSQVVPDIAEELPEPRRRQTTIGDWTGVLPDDRDASTRRHRSHQGEWRTAHADWPAGPPQKDRRVRQRYETLPNWLAETHKDRDVRTVGKNLMSDEAISYTHARLASLAPIDGKAEPDRLWRNLLSSQPLAFSIAGHLSAHRSAAAQLFASLTSLDVVGLASLDPGDAVPREYLLDGIDAEWFPPRKAHTNDMSGCDIAACLELRDGRRVLVTIEVKYTDTFSAKPLEWTPRYQAHLEALGLDRESVQTLVSAGCSQVLRQLLLTDSVRRNGIAPDVGPAGRVDDAIAVVLARHDDGTARHVAATLGAAVGSKVAVEFWSHRDLLQCAAQVPGLEEWAERLRERYVLDAE